jgi:predicted permease
VNPQLGRSFRDDEAATPGTESVAIISDGLWHRLLAANPAAIGQSLPVNGRNVTIIGIMPPRFGFPDHHDVWMPYRLARDSERDRRNVFAVGLVRTGVSLEAARSEVRSMAESLGARFPGTNRNWGVHILPLRDSFVREATERALAAMLVAVVLVLLVGCANIASLMVARGIGRQRELTVRAALGAGRWRLIRLLMAEASLLSIAGGYLGLLFASWGLTVLVASNPEPPPYWATFDIDARVVLFAFGLVAATAAICGIIPALRGSAVNMSNGLLQSGRSSSTTPAQRRFQGTLVAAQVAVCFALLVSAALLARSTVARLQASVGFDTRPLLSMRLYLAGQPYDSAAARGAALAHITKRVTAIPGVRFASATGAIPADDGGQAMRLVPERPRESLDGEIGAQAVPITAALFSTFGLDLREGRVFTDAETVDPSSDVVLIGQRLAEEFWPDQSATGRVLRVAEAGGVTSRRIVGVVPDIFYEEFGEETEQSRRIVYVPYARAGWRTMALLVRTTGNSAALGDVVRRAIREVEPSFAAYDVMSMDERRIFTNWGERFLGRMFIAFAVSALLLSCIGAYGLTAYSAAERTREIGVRLAVGATRRDIVGLLLGRGARLGLVGMLAGAPLAVLAARLVRDLLFGVSAWDAPIWAIVPTTLFAAVMIAGFLPARRASLVDPAQALRTD